MSAVAHPVKYFQPAIDNAIDCSSGLLAMLEGIYGSPMVHATLDDVGTKDRDGISAVVGYVTYSEQWRKFNWRWKITLEQLKVPYLHTTEHLNKFPLIGGSGLTDDDVYTILTPFIAAVREHLIDGGAFGVSVITEWDAYEKLTDTEKKFIRPPDVHSFEMAIGLAAKRMSNVLDPDNCMSVQLDESHDAPKYFAAYEIMKARNETLRRYLSALCFCDDKLHPPVQAADMLGNLLLKAWRSYKANGGWPKAFKELVLPEGRTNVKQLVYDFDALKELARMRMDAHDRMAIE